MKPSGPFRYDIVGSFLRPDYLKQARADYEANKITKDQLQEVEDEAIKELVKQQQEIGLKAVTDGEFRRKYWHFDFISELMGLQLINMIQVVHLMVQWEMGTEISCKWGVIF